MYQQNYYGTKLNLTIKQIEAMTLEEILELIKGVEDESSQRRNNCKNNN